MVSRPSREECGAAGLYSSKDRCEERRSNPFSGRDSLMLLTQGQRSNAAWRVRIVLVMSIMPPYTGARGPRKSAAVPAACGVCVWRGGG